MNKWTMVAIAVVAIYLIYTGYVSGILDGVLPSNGKTITMTALTTNPMFMSPTVNDIIIAEGSPCSTLNPFAIIMPWDDVGELEYILDGKTVGKTKWVQTEFPPSLSYTQGTTWSVKQCVRSGNHQATVILRSTSGATLLLGGQQETASMTKAFTVS